jgi:hypothetical protein
MEEGEGEPGGMVPFPLSQGKGGTSRGGRRGFMKNK